MRTTFAGIIFALALFNAVAEADGFLIEGYIKRDGQPVSGMEVKVAAGCENHSDSLLIPIIANSAVGAVGIQLPASSLPKGEKHTRTDKEGHYRLAVKRAGVYYFTAGGGNAYALVNVTRAGTVRYDPELSKGFNAIWCLVPPLPWMVTVVDGATHRQLAPRPWERSAGSASSVTRPPLDQNDALPWWQDDTELLWAKDSNASEVSISQRQRRTVIGLC